MKTVLDIINALTSLGIVGFLIYFFIYYRKPVKSVLEALGEVDKFRAGPVEFTRRKQMNKFVKEFSVTKAESDEMGQKELKIKLLKMSTVALVAGVRTPNLTDKVALRGIKEIYEEVYKDLSSLEPKPAILVAASQMVTDFVKDFESL